MTQVVSNFIPNIEMYVISSVRNVYVVTILKYAADKLQRRAICLMGFDDRNKDIPGENIVEEGLLLRCNPHQNPRSSHFQPESASVS